MRETVATVSGPVWTAITPLKRGINGTKWNQRPRAAARLRISIALVLLCLGAAARAAVDLPPTWHWSNPTPHGADIFSLARYLDTYIEVCEQGQVFTSDDLSLWTAQDSHTTASLRAVTLFGGRVVIVGEAGTVLFSDDLQSFYFGELEPVATTTNWLEGVAASSTMAVAVGDAGTIYASADGVIWTHVPVSFTKWLNGAAFGAAGTFVVVGESGFIATSTDGFGLVWTSHNSGTTANLNWVAWEGNQFVAVGDGGLTLTSATGATWQTTATGATNFLYATAGSTNSHLIAGDSELRLKQTANWSNQLASTLASPPPNWTYYTAAWSTNLTNVYVVCGTSGMTAIGANTNTATSWYTPTAPIRSWLWQVMRTPDLYLAVGNNGTILSSADGYAWSVELTPSPATNSVLLGVGGSTNLWLAVGSKGTVLWGTNAFLWNLLTPPTTNDLEGVLFDGAQFILTGDNGTILTSADGSTWTKRTTPTTSFLTSVALFPGHLVAVGDKGTILTSTNRINWTMKQLTTNWLSQVAYLNGALIAVGNNGTILTSVDATNWTVRTSGVTNWLNALDYMTGTWFVVGNEGTVLGSPNLTNWTSFGTLTSKPLYGVAHNAGQLVVVGAEGAILRSQINSPSTPVNITNYSRSSGQNLFLFSGQLDQQFFLYSSTNLAAWVQGPLLDFPDNTGTLLYLQDAETNPPPRHFYRTSAVQ